LFGKWCGGLGGVAPMVDVVAGMEGLVVVDGKLVALDV